MSMYWLIPLAVLCALEFLPVGFRAVYRQSQPGVWLLIGPVKVRVFPGKPKKEKTQGKKKQSEANYDGKKGGKFRDFLPITRTILEFLGHFRRKIRVNNLELKLILADDDPCTLARNYGSAWASLGNLMPQPERFFTIKNRCLEVECDFTAEETLIFAKADVTITVARALHLLSRYGIRVLKDLLNLKKLRKGGAKL